ncbi:glycoside hydrolase family 75 protein [Akanthomyces lecanii RCEF 1005]|uniref:Endo-chitosanase n=1 Tax=Akanthomyces lecanii RCEF 1005 TaxID=1081108 RepID=A0A167VA59_CORDF|nr:glycoside hydrolase family 75 protein [Akanthomyces lecanii RCEF 1005]
MKASAAILSLLATVALSREVPPNVRSLYKSIRDKGQCSNVLKPGFYSFEGDSNDFSYCGDHLESDGILYVQGKGHKLTNMDIDCDGILSKKHGDCDSSGDIQHETRFKAEVQSYKKGLKDLDAYVHSYVVLGNEGSKHNYIEFDPQSVGIEPLSVVAVVCGDKMFYGVWGDTNGDDGPPLVGEASLTIGEACYGKGINGNNGHDENDVLYIAFRGNQAVPGANGAAWTAKTFTEFENSLAKIGDKLVKGIKA